MLRVSVQMNHLRIVTDLALQKAQPHLHAVQSIETEASRTGNTNNGTKNFSPDRHLSGYWQMRLTHRTYINSGHLLT